MLSPDHYGTGHGASVVIHQDNMILVGAPLDDTNGYKSGSVFVYKSSMNNSNHTNSLKWTQISKLYPHDPDEDDYFGSSMDIDENTVIIGASKKTTIHGDAAGSAYIFNYDISKKVWNETAKLVPREGDTYEYFGRAVAILNDKAFISTDEDVEYSNVGVTIENAGSVYVFKYNRDNNSWIESGKLISRYYQHVGSFGSCLSINKNFLIVGDYLSDRLINSSSSGDVFNSGGVAYVFEYNIDNDSWIETALLEHDDVNNYDRFGQSVAISSQSNLTIIGSGEEAYIFEYDNEYKKWNQLAKLTTDSADENILFGSTVSISQDGDIVIIGANDDDDDCGSAYIFNRINKTIDNWVEVGKLVSGDGAAQYLGYSIAMNDNNNLTVIGGVITGPAYVFDLNEIGTIDALSNTPYLTINIDYESDTEISISGIDDDNNDLVYTINECDIDDTDWRLSGGMNNLNVWAGFIGCFEITFSDCDSDSVNNGYQVYSHGIYEIILNEIDAAAAYGGYYIDSETQTICTNDFNQVSLCITPGYCVNNNNLWAFSDSEDDISMQSYQSMTNSKLEGRSDSTTSYLGIDCGGDHSCNNDTVIQNDETIAIEMRCSGYYACVESTFVSSDVSITCSGIESCRNITATSDAPFSADIVLYELRESLAFSFFVLPFLFLFYF